MEIFRKAFKLLKGGSRKYPKKGAKGTAFGLLRIRKISHASEEWQKTIIEGSPKGKKKRGERRGPILRDGGMVLSVEKRNIQGTLRVLVRGGGSESKISASKEHRKKRKRSAIEGYDEGLRG